MLSDYVNYNVQYVRPMAVRMDKKEQLVDKYTSKPGFKSKIIAMCIQCIYDQGCGGGNYLQQIEACTVKNCALYSVRPKSKSRKNETDK